MAGAEDAGEQRGADDDVEPFLDDLAVDAGELQHEVGEDRRHDQLPHALDPEMHDVPPVHLVEREVGGIVEGEQEQDGDAPQADQQDVGDGGLAAGEHGHRDVVEKHECGDDDADLDPQRLLEELAPLFAEQEIAVEQVENVGDDDAEGAEHEDRELVIGDLR